MVTHSIYEDGTYLKANKTWHEEDSPWKAKHIFNMLEKNNIKPRSLCDVGCGAGEVLRCLWSAYGKDVKCSGYDISPNAFEIAKQKESNNLEFIRADVFCENNKNFDVVMAIDVFEHVDDYLGFLRNIKSVGSYKIFHIPLDLSVQTVFRAGPLDCLRKHVGHLHYFTKETALASLEYAGYEIVDYFYTPGSLDDPNRGWKARLMNIPRRAFYNINNDITVRLFGGYSLMVLAK